MLATTTAPVKFSIHCGQSRRLETYPAGTLVQVDPSEMESNPGFFQVTIPDYAEAFAYVSTAAITAA